MKRLLKKLLPISAFTITTLTSCATTGQPQELFTIKIISELEDVTITQNSSHKTKPLQVKCYDSNNKEVHMDVKFTLTLDGNNPAPDWISITENNEIYINAPTTIGTYMISVSAYNEAQSIYSLSKSFVLKVVEDTTVIPEKITLSIEDNPWCMFGEKTTISTTVIPYKKDVDPQLLDNKCGFKMEITSGNDKDLDGNPLFALSDSNVDPILTVSNKTDKTYIGEYKIKIQAYLLAKPSITDTKEICINIDDVTTFTDEKGNVYSRNTGQEPWTLTKIPAKVEYLVVNDQKMQNNYVTKIGEALSANSGNSTLVEIELPKSVQTIEANAFLDQEYLTTIGMPGVENVGESAFKNCVSMTLNVEFDQPCLKYADNYAFYNCKKLQISKKQDLHKIGEYAFAYGNYDSFEIRENCEEIGTGAFNHDTNLSSFTIRTIKPPKIGGSVFTGSRSFSTIRVPSQSLTLYQNDVDWKSTYKNFEGI